MTLILASASPRRQEILSRLGLTFQVIPAQSEPTPDPSLSPKQAVLRIARAKAEEVAARFPTALTLGADTVVALPTETGETLLGKPHSKEEAAAMLRRLQGTEHRVLTGVWLAGPADSGGFVETTRVSFFPMTEADIADYVATGEPLDKAGAYGIQGFGMRYIRSIAGDYYTVMGLPAARCWQEIRKRTGC